MIYLASPYTYRTPNRVERNWMQALRFEWACEATAALLRQGIHVLSPIAHSHSIAIANALPTGFDFWERFDHALIRMCDRFAVLPLPGWRESEGVRRETLFAASIGISPEYLTPDDLPGISQELANALWVGLREDGHQ